MRRRLTCVAALAIGLGASSALANPFTDFAALPTFYTEDDETDGWLQEGLVRPVKA
ncbi:MULTISPECIES: hypothetical protein [unclassified Mesorhizobium]|uniref:hypothetical protein n=1 Tax=unclassified Mesorhizobium TaxID=325217 RepID=UPI001596DB50|nr:MULTISPECIES: hypothetical protein [unclassified Mesorhizobium]